MPNADAGQQPGAGRCLAYMWSTPTVTVTRTWSGPTHVRWGAAPEEDVYLLAEVHDGAEVTRRA